VLNAGAANLVSLAATAIVNTAANRRLTFRVRGRERLVRDHLGGILALGAALAVTSLSLAALQWLLPGASRLEEIATLTAANVVATGLRFLLLRTFLFHARAAAPELRRPGASAAGTVSGPT